jgi:Spy/CpxP family protein refolding chaperone
MPVGRVILAKGASEVKIIRNPALSGRLLTLFLVSFLALTGCGDSGSILGADDEKNSIGDPGELLEDPLDGALDSALGYTPTDSKGRIDRLAEILGLDEVQKEALADAYAELRTGLQALRDQVKSGELTKQEARDQALALRESFEAELQVILTAEQYEQLQEMRSNRGGRGHGGSQAEARWEAWLAEIDADDTQVEAVMGALDVFREGMQNLRAEVKDGTLTRDEARLAAQELRAEFDAALQEILTPEQYEALQELRPDCPGGHGNHGQ